MAAGCAGQRPFRIGRETRSCRVFDDAEDSAGSLRKRPAAAARSITRAAAGTRWRDAAFVPEASIVGRCGGMLLRGTRTDGSGRLSIGNVATLRRSWNVIHCNSSTEQTKTHRIGLRVAVDVIVLAVDASGDVRTALQSAAATRGVGTDGRQHRHRHHGRRFQQIDHLLVTQGGYRYLADLHQTRALT